MNAEYEAAKRVALGLEMTKKASAGADIWSISLGDGLGITGEMPNQYFEFGFEATSEQQAQKAALMLYDSEFEADRSQAEQYLDSLTKLLKNGDAEGLKSLFLSAPAESWLSLIFLPGDGLKQTLAPLLRQAPASCRAITAEALQMALKKMVVFQELTEALLDCCR